MLAAMESTVGSARPVFGTRKHGMGECAKRREIAVENCDEVVARR